MRGEELQRLARETAQTLAGVSESYPFTEHVLVYKVNGRVFLIVTEDPDEPIITVKAEPPRAEALIREHQSVQRGRYLDKRHWISIGSGKSVAAGCTRRPSGLGDLRQIPTTTSGCLSTHVFRFSGAASSRLRVAARPARARARRRRTSSTLS